MYQPTVLNQPSALSTYWWDAMPSMRKRFDAALMRYDAWFLVFTAVILALGATLIAGMALWCILHEKGTFTGRWEFKDFGLNVYFECAS